jgi:type I restriction enzyme M protein
MLDTETKRRINSCRDILVGKVPDPKSQVEQITIALIYKFMDDMELESEEFGGQRTFFAEEFERYRWAKLLAPGVGGQEMLNTYTEALTKMVENPGIPELFRTIFRNAYLPYRDPETLRSFLREINGFTYDHSERLGDAFEYLLSVLGSQGDAGQFRTPRHIIDFMVEIIDPKKDEVILDPACGTAGFLISSYKHILKANTDTPAPDVSIAEVDAAEATLDNPVRYSAGLSPEERLRLSSNIKGYDISPDMVRLSLVNLYLHGFLDPKIDEYDTLTSDDRWGQPADVILANPPFMSPKGGIKPHNRFGVQSKRSEVLFVDYIAEHLSPNGRAAIVVPEGIIFQSQSAYCDLRRRLVEGKYLAAVISLPAGVFNPYSGVKTSILVLDRAVAKASDSIAFFKIENDGFSLGAQRRTVKGSQLPQVKAELGAWLAAVREGAEEAMLDSALGHAVAKVRIAEDGEYNLSGERYRENTKLANLAWPAVSLAEVCRFMTGGTPTSTEPSYYQGGNIPWLVSGDIHQGEIFDCEKRITQAGMDNSNARILPTDSVLIALNGQGKTRGTVAILRMNNATCNQSLVAMSPLESSQLLSEYLFRVLRTMYQEIRDITGDNQRSGLNIPLLKSIKIPLPPLEMQREIVVEIEGYQKVIDGARTVLENYRPYISIDPTWPVSAIKEIATTITPPAKLQTSEYREAGQFPIIDQSQDFIAGWTDRSDAVIDPADGLVVFGDHTCAIKFVDQSFVQGADGIKILKPVGDLSAAYLAHYLQAYPLPTDGYRRHFSLLKDHQVALPPIETQQAIVAEIKAEQALVEANRELIARFEKKIEAAIARVWGGAEEAIAA